MKIINIATGETVAEITTNHSMSLDDAIDLVGEFDHWDPNPDILIAGNIYHYDDLALEW